MLGMLLAPSVALAHGVGQPYALPVPLQDYLFGAGFAVAASFVVLAFAFRTAPKPSVERPHWRVPFLRPLLVACRGLAVAALALLVVAGIFGSQHPAENIAPVFFWFYALIGLAVVSTIVGNGWNHVNPFATIARWSNGARVSRGTRWMGGIAVGLLLALSWWELISARSYLPAVIGFALLAYTYASVWMHRMFGAAWFEEGEASEVLFGWFGRLAFLSISEDERFLRLVRASDRLDGVPASGWMIGVAAALLAGTTLDGLQETAFWAALLPAVGLGGASQLVQTAALLLLVLLFAATYLAVCWMIAKLTRHAAGAWDLARRFVWSLAPIAFGYALAHNFSMLISSAPQLLGLVSDPFGRGWDVFHTVRFETVTYFLDAKTVWFLEIALVVGAHVLGVLYAHLLALRIFPDAKTAVRSQLPMALLMVGYTVFTLWMLSQPLVVGH